jgi:hypothetical protein
MVVVLDVQFRFSKEVNIRSEFRFITSVVLEQVILSSVAVIASLTIKQGRSFRARHSWIRIFLEFPDQILQRVIFSFNIQPAFGKSIHISSTQWFIAASSFEQVVFGRGTSCALVGTEERSFSWARCSRQIIFSNFSLEGLESVTINLDYFTCFVQGFNIRMVFWLIAAHQFEVVVLSCRAGHTFGTIVERLGLRTRLSGNSILSYFLLQIDESIFSSFDNFSGFI